MFRSTKGDIVQRHSMIWYTPVAFESNAALEGHLHLGLPSETWLRILVDVIAQLNLNKYRKDAYHQG